MKASATKPRQTRLKAGSQVQGLLVLGMHRSGTSAITRVLNLLGCALPDDLIGPGDGNTSGHWEAVKAVNLNDEILTSAGSSWDDWGPINADWYASGTREAMLERISEVATEHAALGPLFVLKDPRLCRLANLWLDGLKNAGIEPRVILMVRKPEEVSASLDNRDLMSPGYGQLLWLRHVLDAEFFSRGTRRVVCRYDLLLDDWRGTVANIRTSLGIALPRNAPAVHGQIDAFLDGSHRHHESGRKAALAELDPADWIGRTYAILHRWSENGEDQSDHTELDTIRAEFNGAYATFAPLLLTSDAAGALGSGSELRREMEARRNEADLTADQARQALQEIEAAKASHVARIADLEARLAGAEAKSTALGAEVSRLEQSTQELCSSLESQQVMASELATERERLSVELVAATEALRNAELRIAELTGQVAATESALLQRQEELAQWWEQARAAERASAVVEAELVQEREQRKATESALADLRDELEKAREKAVAADLAAEEARKLADLEHAQRRAAEDRVSSVEEELNDLRERLDEALEAPVEPPQHLLDENMQLNQQLRAQELARSEAEQKLSMRFDEIARITAMLAEEGHRADSTQANALWLAEMAKIAQVFPKWWPLMPSRWRQQREHRRYRNAGLFDAQAYLAANPDVAAHGMDPVRHYLLHGMAEGRPIAMPD